MGEVVSKKRWLSFWPNGFIAAAVMLGSVLLATPSRGDTPGPLGVGIVIGDPTGLSANYRLSQERSIDAAVAWSFGKDPGFELHADYLWQRESLFRFEKVEFDWHYGIGARLLSARDRKSDEKLHLGPRVPIGLSTDFNKNTLEAFAELALAMNLIPATTADFDFGIGIRVYF